MDLSEGREFYVHDVACTDDFTEPNERGLRTCLGCAGIFDSNGRGVAITDNRLDENYEQRLEDEIEEKKRWNIFKG